MKHKVFLLLSILFLSVFNPTKGETNPNETSLATINGYIKDSKTGEELIGANVFVHEIKTGTVTNFYGFYSITLSPGKYNLRISYVGYNSVEKELTLARSMQLNIELEPQSNTLKEFVVSSKQDNENITSASMGVTKMNAETIKKIPAFMGEVDVLKAIQMLPGVQMAAEGFSGFSVRGGSTDQNLMLLDEAVVYNASHLLGFFSVFNSDAIKDMVVYKGDIPAQYGGRLSSLIDIRMREGNMKKYCLKGGVGSISSRLTLEGPLVKDKSSFIVSGRRTYADKFLQFSKDTLLKDNKLYFYDLNLKANYIINEKNRIFFSTYSGRDVFAFRNMFNMNWGNVTQTLRWNSIVSEKLFVNTSLIHSNYQYVMDIEQGVNKFQWTSSIRDYTFKNDYTYYLNPQNQIKFGGIFSYHNFKPGSIKTFENKNNIDLQENNTLEYALYLSNEQKVKSRLTLNYGIRFSAYHNIGESKVFEYDENYKVKAYKEYKKGEIYNTNLGLEPRLSSVYVLNELSSVKGSYSRTRQYVQLASNSSAGMPTDVWFPVSPNIKPQISDQASVGYFRNIFDNLLETSVEVYYKDMRNQIDFKDNAQLFFNDKLEGEIRTGIAKSYGLELLVKKEKGKFSGWVAYTLSKAMRKVDDINNNNWYNSNFDKPHNLSLVLNYDINKRINLGFNWVYTSGSPITLPTSRWEFAGTIIPGYSERNGYRLPDYHRMDVSATFQLNKDENSKFKNELNVSIFNVYNRKNPFTIYFERESAGSEKTQAYALSMFGIVPSITWNFNF